MFHGIVYLDLCNSIKLRLDLKCNLPGNTEGIKCRFHLMGSSDCHSGHLYYQTYVEEI